MSKCCCCHDSFLELCLSVIHRIFCEPNDRSSRIVIAEDELRKGLVELGGILQRLLCIQIVGDHL